MGRQRFKLIISKLKYKADDRLIDLEGRQQARGYGTVPRVLVQCTGDCPG